MAECAIPDCDIRATRKGWCDAHYRRWRRHGDPLHGGPLWHQGGECSIDGCARPARSRGWCSLHYSRWVRHGDPLVSMWGGITYGWVHRHLRKTRGRAAEHPCADCGKQAYEWSYRGGAPDEMVDPTLGSPFSGDPDFYEPRCKKCHIAYDDVMARVWEKRRST